MHVLSLVKKKSLWPRGLILFSQLCPRQARGSGGQDYRLAFFEGASSTLCWPLVRAPGGLASLLRLLEGESWAFDLQ